MESDGCSRERIPGDMSIDCERKLFGECHVELSYEIVESAKRRKFSEKISAASLLNRWLGVHNELSCCRKAALVAVDISHRHRESHVDR